MIKLDLPSFPGYQISTEGVIWSKKSNRWLKMKPNSLGYARTELYHEGKRVHVFNHIKVVALFGDCNGNKIPNNSPTLRSLGLSIDHLDENKMNPNQSNLELVTHSENVSRYYRKKDRSTEIPDLD